MTKYYVCIGPGISYGEFEGDAPPPNNYEFVETFETYRAFRDRLDQVEDDLPGVLRGLRAAAPPLKPRDYLPWYRWKREVGGVVLPSGAVVRTSRESQAQLTSALSSVTMGLTPTPIRWKLENGQWVDLTEVELSEMTSAVAKHVRACFFAEEEVEEVVEGMTREEVAAAFDAAYEAFD